MAIKEFITLEGVETVQAQLKKLADVGEQALSDFRKQTGDVKLPTLEVPKVDVQPVQDLTEHTLKLTEAFHALRPVLAAAGIQMGELGAFARVAGNSMLALSLAVAGSVIVGLAKLEENAARTKGQLADLFGSSAKGDQAFAALGKQAEQFGTTVGGLAPGLESFQEALNNIDRTAKGFRALKEEDLPGAQLAKNAGALTEAYGNFIKVLRAGRLDQDQAEKSAKAFFDTLKEGGVVTSAALRNLPTGTINLLKDAFGQAGLTAKQFFALVDTGAISADNFEKALINFGPQAQQAFDTKAIKSFSDEFGKILTTLSAGFKSLSGGTGFSDFIIGELKRIREGIEATITDLQKLKQFETDTGSDVIGKIVTSITNALKGIKPSEQGFDEAGFIALADTVQKLPPKFLDASNSLQKLGAAGLIAGTQTSKAMDQASASIQNLRDKAKETGQEMQDIVSGSTIFKGRLDQIPVFQPQLAGETDPTGKAAGAKFVEAAQSEMTKLVIPPEAQQNLEQQLGQVGTQGADSLNAAFQASIPQNLTIAQALYDGWKAIFATPIPVNFDARSPLQSTAPFAGGGMVHGRGTTTSDSILAWLSNKEYVVNARAVSHYGADLFAALNSMRLPRDFIGGFSMGGLARAISGNRFAAGGQVNTSGNRTLTLMLAGKQFSMTGSKHTVDALEREASLRGLAMIGKAPSWVGKV